MAIGSLKVVLSCRIQQLMLSNTIVKLSAVFLFATPAVLIGGEVYSILTGSTPLEGFLKIYSVLYIIPGEAFCPVRSKPQGISLGSAADVLL